MFIPISPEPPSGQNNNSFFIYFINLAILINPLTVSYTHLRAHETKANLVCRLLLEKKYYRGGIIAPGVKISLDTLFDKASLIPRIDLKKIRNIVGNNTISAVRSGFFWGYIGLIDNIINLIKKETRKSFKLVITGGYSDLFRKSLKTRVIQNKDITIKGLIKISKLIK